jgi:23S rRNA pseudouridine1911/1915/1917 synthase
VTARPSLIRRETRGHRPRLHLKLVVTAEHSKKPLNLALADWLPGALGRTVSKAKVRKLIMAGAVHLNGRSVRNPSIELTPGMSIEAHIDPAKLFEDLTSRDRKFELTPDRILFEDPDLIVVDKPSGLPAHPTSDEARDNLFAAVTRFLAKRDGGVPYIGLHQRLDRGTSGVVLFTKTQRVNAAIADVFSRHVAVKVYHALTTSSRKMLQKEWTIKNYLGKVSSRSKRAKYGAVDSDGQLAETSFRVIEQHPHGVWIEAIPQTGRTHQIRVHLSEYGLPILGDDLYGSETSVPRLMLHAVELRFPHPITKIETSVRSPLPKDFKHCLAGIRRQ